VTAPRSLLADIRAAFDDLDAVGLDMLKTPRRRNLGPRERRRLYREARNKLAALLAPLDNDGDRGDSAGSGGSGAE
jgi:hypothetical protein